MCGLPTEAFVFCCFNNAYKIMPAVFERWCALLHAVPDSVLWLYEANPQATDNLLREAGERGIDPGRIFFAPFVAQEKHLARLAAADLFLDTLPYNAHTTASDALWAGVPLVTCIGDTFASRVAASLLRAVGCDELITRSLDEYQALALELAGDRARLAGIRQRLIDSREVAPLFDSPRFAIGIEQLFERMAQRHREGLAPDSLWATEDER
jgi:predicted O-linked N-acetylglucosamine transferase (SPINDLY family)